MHDFSEFHVRQVRCILRNRASLDLELFTNPSDRDFLRVHQPKRPVFPAVLRRRKHAPISPGSGICVKLC